jgi:protein-disulfide isomerase
MKTVMAVAAVATLSFFSPPGFAQTTELEALNKEIEALKAGQQAIQRDLQEIKTLLRSRLAAGAPAAPQNPIISVEGAHFRGEKTAKLTLVEFSDFQ